MQRSSSHGQLSSTLHDFYHDLTTVYTQHCIFFVDCFCHSLNSSSFVAIMAHIYTYGLNHTIFLAMAYLLPCVWITLLHTRMISLSIAIPSMSVLPFTPSLSLHFPYYGAMYCIVELSGPVYGLEETCYPCNVMTNQIITNPKSH